MKILVFSDVHADLRALRKLLEIEADYYFAAGDLVSWARGLESVGKVLAARGEKVCVLPGNHESADEVDAMCQRHGLTPLHGRSFETAGFHIAGLGYSTPTPFNTPGEWSEQEMADHLVPFAELDPLVMVCHCPPHGTQLDRMHNGIHAGSKAVREFIDTHHSVPSMRRRKASKSTNSPRLLMIFSAVSS